MPSRTAARRAIDAGLVRVGSVTEPKPSTMVSSADSVALVAAPARFVGRGGEKLEAALAFFGIEVSGRTAIDVGASTGGFTDCLLQRGAVAVVSLDVGYGQLHWRLRNDDRVTVVERTNIRHADAAALGAPFDLVVADISFISLAKVAAPLAALGSDQTDWVLLVKPQFEVGREDVGPGGIVRDPEVHARAIVMAAAALERNGLVTNDLVASPIAGAEGNREFLIRCARGGNTIDRVMIESVVQGGAVR